MKILLMIAASTLLTGCLGSFGGVGFSAGLTTRDGLGVSVGFTLPDRPQPSSK